jgi:hypothetical protein
MEVAQSLRETITEARPIDAADLALPEVRTEPGVHADELATRASDAENMLRDQPRPSSPRRSPAARPSRCGPR